MMAYHQDYSGSSPQHFKLPFLTSIVNESLATSIFPLIWKRPIITPLAKKVALNYPPDTQPSAQLPTISKVLEKIVHSQLHLTTNNNHPKTIGMLNPRQSGV